MLAAAQRQRVGVLLSRQARGSFRRRCLSRCCSQANATLRLWHQRDEHRRRRTRGPPRRGHEPRLGDRLRRRELRPRRARARRRCAFRPPVRKAGSTVLHELREGWQRLLVSNAGSGRSCSSSRSSSRAQSRGDERPRPRGRERRPRRRRRRSGVVLAASIGREPAHGSRDAPLAAASDAARRDVRRLPAGAAVAGARRPGAASGRDRGLRVSSPAPRSRSSACSGTRRCSRRSRRRSLSRLAAYDALGSLFLSPLGLAAAGPIAAAVGTRATFIGAAVLIVVATALVFLSRDVRTLERR